MSLTHSTDCPHCFTANSGFTYVAEVPHLTSPGAQPSRFTLIFRCNSCYEAVGIKITSTAGRSSFATGRSGDLVRSIDFDPVKSAFKLLGQYPDRREVVIPAHLSASTERCYRQGQNAADREEYDSAGAMFRKCIDIATRELDNSTSGKKLAARIEALWQSGKLTESLRDWAHEVRLDGNDAAHDDDPLSREEIEQLASFTDLFLRYTFTLPAQVKARKTDRAE